MRKKILVVLMILVVSLTGIHQVVYADEATPYFNVVASVDTAIAIGGSTVDFIIDVYTDYSTALDRVRVDAYLMGASGTKYATYGTNLDKDGRVFTFESYKKVTKTDVYFLKYTLKCYKDGEIVDTISGSTKNVVYTA